MSVWPQGAPDACGGPCAGSAAASPRPRAGAVPLRSVGVALSLPCLSLLLTVFVFCHILIREINRFVLLNPPQIWLEPTKPIIRQVRSKSFFFLTLEFCSFKMLLFLTFQIQGVSRCPLSLVWTADEPGNHFAVNLRGCGWGRASSAGFSGGLGGPRLLTSDMLLMVLSLGPVCKNKYAACLH